MISTSFADIFQAELAEEFTAAHRRAARSPCRAIRESERDSESRSGLSNPDVYPSGRAVEFPVDAFAKHCLLEGIDELGYILQQEPAITLFEAANPAPINALA